MYSYMNRNILKILTALFAITVFIGTASGVASNLSVSGDPINNSGIIYASGNHDTDFDGFNANTIEFNISDGSTFKYKGVDINASADNSNTAGKFNFTLYFSDYSKTFSDGLVNISADQSDFGFDEYETNSSFIMDSSPPVATPTISSTEQIAGGGINITFGDIDSVDAETVVYEVHRIESLSGSFPNIVGSVKDDNSTSYEFKDNSSLLKNGTQYSYKVRANDSAGNVGDWSNPESNYSDSEGPSVYARDPVIDSFTNDVQRMIRFNLSDSNGFDTNSISISVSDSDSETELSDEGTDNGSISLSDSEQILIDPTADPIFDYNEGGVDVSVSVVDGIGNTRTDSWSFTVDTTDPSVSIDNPSNGDTVSSQDSINGGMDDSGNGQVDYVELQIKAENDSYWTNPGWDTQPDWFNVTLDDATSWSYNSEDITSDSRYSLDVRATDDAGNLINPTKDVSYTIDTGAPGIKTAFINDTSANGVSDTVVVNFTENIDGSESDLGEAFRVDEGSLGLVDFGASQDDSRVLIPISGIQNTSFQPTLKMLNGTVVDAAGNSLSDNTTEVLQDKARPVLMHATVNSSSSNSSSTVVKLEFSEAVQDSADNNDIVIDGTSIDFVGATAGDSRNIDYGEVLDTSRHPNVTGFDSVADIAGNSAVLFQESNVTVSTFRREMDEGWNFVSFPISSNSAPSITSFFDDSDVSKVWTYRDGEWIVYNNDKPGANLSYVYGGRGYLFDVKNSFTMAPNVENVMNERSTPETPPSIGLEEGWNLVGHYQEFNQYDNVNSSGAFSSIWNSLGTVYGPRSDSGLNLRETSGVIKPGYAYWVSTRGDLSGGSVVYSEN